MSHRVVLILLASTTLVSGCVVGPRYVGVREPVAGAFAGSDLSAQDAPLSRAVSRNGDVAQWWKRFGDPELDVLIERALAANLDRQTAASRVREARQTAAEARAQLFPMIMGDGAAAHVRIGENAGLSKLSGSSGSGGGMSGASGASGGGSTPSISLDTYTAGLTASYAPDLFGGQTSALAAAQERAEERVWNARDTDVTVTSDVARAYLQLRADQARLAVVTAQAKSQADLLGLIGARHKGGLLTDVDVVQQRSQLSTTQAQIAPLEASAASGVHQLSILLALDPAALTAELAPVTDPLSALPPAPPEIPVGLPSDLLKRRPDVRAAERELAATVGDVDQATAAQYPSIPLTGSFDLLSSSLSTFLDAGSRDYLYAAALTAPIFDAGRLRARKREAEERAVQAGLAYRKTVLTDLQQTADALTAYAADQRRLTVLRKGFEDGARAVVLTRAQYLGGLQDLQATLRAQSTALQTQDQLVKAQASLATDLVTLYRALGGGWEGDPPSTTAKGVRASTASGTKKSPAGALPSPRSGA